MDVFRVIGDYIADAWSMITSRAGGPFHVRLIVQPLVAAVLGIRAGRADARAGRPPYFWSIFGSDVDDRRALLGDGWGDVRKVFLIALALDVIYEVVVFRWVYPVQALLVAVMLAMIPYLICRGITNRMARPR